MHLRTHPPIVGPRRRLVKSTLSKLLEFGRRDLREVGRRWVRILLEGLLVLVNLLERGSKDPSELAADLNILVGIHFDVDCK